MHATSKLEWDINGNCMEAGILVPLKYKKFKIQEYSSTSFFLKKIKNILKNGINV